MDSDNTKYNNMCEDKEYITGLENEIHRLHEDSLTLRRAYIDRLEGVEEVYDSLDKTKKNMNEMEMELYCLRLFLLYVIYMYIFGYIKYTF